ncbi:MAG TPA: aspartyl/glutamyl-tRNA amidotransferase subunit C [Longimicrobiales bacterium]|nr:aspartyl/glutamyl-tRNA amidotransferase subunit C [Longimicrobiales bacterium]
MAIEHDDALRIADLAGLPPPDDVERTVRELAGILEQMEMLAEVPADEADAGPAAARVHLREDEPGADALVRPARELAPEWCEGFFTVPRLPALGAEDG